MITKHYVTTVQPVIGELPPPDGPGWTLHSAIEGEHGLIAVWQRDEKPCPECTCPHPFTCYCRSADPGCRYCYGKGKLPA